MQRTGKRLLVATIVAAVGMLAAGPTASAKMRTPEQPKLKSAKTALAKKSARAQSSSLEIVSLGFDSYSGLELYVLKVDGSIVGLPFG